MEFPRVFFAGKNARSRSRIAAPLLPYRKIKSAKHKCDRFIPDRSSVDMELASFLFSQTKKEEELNKVELSPFKDAYRRMLVDTLLPNRTRILPFGSKRDDGYTADRVPYDQTKLLNRCRSIPQGARRVLDAPNMMDDDCLNLLDWGSRNVLAVALGSSVYLWDASADSSEILDVDEDRGPVTSVSWAADGNYIAVGLTSSEVELWDVNSARRLRTLRGVHTARVGALSWNNHILTTGGEDGNIANNDVRIRSHLVQTYAGHRERVCGLKWSGSGRSLASGGGDNLIHIWDVAMASLHASRRQQWLHRFDHHKAAVRALAWCPFQSSLLASGGGENDGCVKVWDTNTGACENSRNTGSSVCALLWNKKERELLSSHGPACNQLTLWKYPSMVKMKELTGHTQRVLYMSQSPDGCTVASAAGDESLRLWNVCGMPRVQERAAKTANVGYGSRFDLIR